MEPKKYLFLVMLVLTVVLIPMAGCTKSQSAARKELTGLNVQYNQDQFLNSAKDGNTKVVELFLQAGMDPNVKNKDGQTALMLAAYSGHIGTVELLIKHGAYINVIDKYGDSALSWAAGEKHMDIVQLLRKEEINKSY
ncbi:MAG: ankyrin repeat domain-containing protein [Deltaproteobacteria bacterium]|nr:ankyrin repeat domain-containing protein [Deltaproteobacteria bacterium]MCL5277350.1 ankyrin repeat domain-containing protein [Deltaproteobacteria bacterium]